MEGPIRDSLQPNMETVARELEQESRQSIRALLASYTQDPLLNEIWRSIRSFGPLRSISADITARCNLRCTGCYFFKENMDAAGEASEEDFERFVLAEELRGTNFVTVLGGEPSLNIGRLRRLARSFRLMVVTNGLKAIPQDGLEHVAIAVSMWGDRTTDRTLRGGGRLDLFDQALANYRSDRRVIWYITLPPKPPMETEEVVEECVQEGHLVGFNYYGDLSEVGGDFDHRSGFVQTRAFIDRMIDRFGGSIAFTHYLNEVVSTGVMGGTRWGHDVCCSISSDHPINSARIKNGNPYSPHFRAYNPDLLSTRRCCVGMERDCSTCFDVWAHTSWVLLNLEQHLRSVRDFAEWLAVAYTFYGVARLVDSARFRSVLPELQRYLHCLRTKAADTASTA